MSDLVTRCEYCSQLVAIADVVTFLQPHHELPDGRVYCTSATYCGRYCAEQHDSSSVSGGAAW